jgi:putative aldouronate transport system permease protein
MVGLATRKAINRHTRTGGEIVFNIINYTVFALFTLLCIYPFYYLIINTISANNLSAGGQIIFLPHQLQLNNYVQVFKLQGLAQAALVSVGRVVFGTFFPVVISTYLGFMFSKEMMWHRKFWYRFVVITMYFGAGIIPTYLTYNSLGLVNSFLVYIIPWLIQPFSIMLVKTYVESTPVSLQESAEIDGAGTMMVFLRIIVPMLTPIIATISIFTAVWQWNSFMDTVIYVTKNELYTLQFILWRYLNQTAALANLIRGNQANAGIIARAATQPTTTSVQMTVTVIVILPILVIYPYFQRFFIKGLMIGAIKG